MPSIKHYAAGKETQLNDAQPTRNRVMQFRRYLRSEGWMLFATVKARGEGERSEQWIRERDHRSNQWTKEHFQIKY